MTEEPWASEASLAKTALSRYEILRALYPDREASLSDLADRIRQDIGNLSRYVTELENLGLAASREKEGGRGKPLRIVRLTNAGSNIVRSIIEAAGTKPSKLEPADPEDLEFFMKMIDDSSHKDVGEIAAGELMSLCESYSVIHDERLLPFLKERILSPHYEPLRFILLGALRNITRNSTAEQIRDRINPAFTDILSSILSKPVDNAQEDDAAIRFTAMEILTLASQGDEGFKYLTTVLTSLIERRDPADERMQDLILSKYPLRKSELRRALFKLLTSPDKDVVRRTKDRILRLRIRQPV